MHEYRIHTLVDITDNGNLKQQFPFKTLAGHEIHDKVTLSIARDQNSNFATMLQLLQMRGNRSNRKFSARFQSGSNRG
jgi:hypothetical protein